MCPGIACVDQTAYGAHSRLDVAAHRRPASAAAAVLRGGDDEPGGHQGPRERTDVHPVPLGTPVPTVQEHDERASVRSRRRWGPSPSESTAGAGCGPGRRRWVLVSAVGRQEDVDHRVGVVVVPDDQVRTRHGLSSTCCGSHAGDVTRARWIESRL